MNIKEFELLLNEKYMSVAIYLPVKVVDLESLIDNNPRRINDILCYEIYINSSCNYLMIKTYNFIISLNMPFYIKLFGKLYDSDNKLYTFHNNGNKYTITGNEYFNSDDITNIKGLKIINSL